MTAKRKRRGRGAAADEHAYCEARARTEQTRLRVRYTQLRQAQSEALAFAGQETGVPDMRAGASESSEWSQGARHTLEPERAGATMDAYSMHHVKSASPARNRHQLQSPAQSLAFDERPC